VSTRVAILLPCPKCGKRVNLQNEYAGKKWKCAGCKLKFRVPDPKRHKLGSVKCTCGSMIETWDVFAKEGVFCPGCKKIYSSGKASKLPSIIPVGGKKKKGKEKKKKKEKKKARPSPAPEVLEIPELEVDDEDLLLNVEEEVIDGAELLIENDLELADEIKLVENIEHVENIELVEDIEHVENIQLVEEIELVSDEQEKLPFPDRRRGARRKGDRRKGDRRKGGRRKSE